MNAPRPPIQPRPTVSARPGLVSRLKLSQPVRLYCYSVLAAIVVALVAVGTVTQEWADVLLGVAAAVLAVVPGAEAARATVYSPAGHVSGILEAVRASDAARADEAVRW